MSRRTVGVVFALAMAAGVQWSAAEVSLAPVFGDHMLLQRNRAVKVWGKADPGAMVTVKAAGQQKATNASPDGKWTVTFDAVPAGGPHQIVVDKSGVGENEQVTVSDVLFGDLWICSGQSNMEWTVRNSDNAEKEIASADHPKIRLMFVKKAISDKPLEQVDAKWEVASPQTIANFSAVGYFFGREVHQQTGVPMGLISTNWGGTPAEAWTPMETMVSHPELKVLSERGPQYVKNYPDMLKKHDEAMVKWEAAKAEAEAAGTKPPQQPRKPAEPDKNPHIPAVLWNAMVHPLLGLEVKGAIWYQGETNAGRAAQYEILLPEMIKAWRKAFGSELSFYIVQLANYGKDAGKLGDSAWAELRQAQTNIAKEVDNTGLAVTIDIGNPDDIHPRNKQDVGRRLALVALAEDYDKDVDHSGPVFEDVEFENGKAHIEFDDAKQLVVKGEKLEGFIIAGQDRNFVPAQARIEGDKVVVWADEVKEPASVRYGWANSPICNLFDESGLPAVPFRTDDWPWVTAANK